METIVELLQHIVAQLQAVLVLQAAVLEVVVLEK